MFERSLLSCKRTAVSGKIARLFNKHYSERDRQRANIGSTLMRSRRLNSVRLMTSGSAEQEARMPRYRDRQLA